jgi:proteasome alpha subunit
MAYDRTIVVFSPDGRLLQVEYARQMVKNGTTAIGIRTADSVILASVRIAMPLAVLESYKKIYEIDSHVATVSSGSLADARELAKLAQVRAQINRITYGEPISILSLATYICDRKHLVTQYAGVRPYGVGLLIGGVDKTGPRLFETEPSGTMIEWQAHGIGRGAEKAKKILQKNYKVGLTSEQGLKLAVNVLKECEKDVSPQTIEAVIVRAKGVEKVSPKMLT